MDFPEPLVVEPVTTHTQTFILLHGRGSWATKFGPPLLETITSSGQTLPQTFPNARFIFLTAPLRRATIYKRARTRQWFNNWHLDPPATDREDLLVPGLHETTLYIHGILRREISNVPGGAKSVVLGGLSQGCAASLTALLLWEGDALAAWFGMCGWLPFALAMLDITTPEEFDPFEREGNGSVSAATWLATELDVAYGSGNVKTALFLGHGVEDDRVDVVLGRKAHECVQRLGYDAQWREYEGLGHWYSPEMLGDVVSFLHDKIH